MTWKQATIGGVISGVAAAAIIGACGIAFGERWSEEAQYLRPTCASPKGLRQIPPATVTASDTSRRRDAKDTNLPVKVLDGYSGSVWTPTDTSITWADVPAPVEPSPEPSSVALAMPKNMLVWPRSSSPSPSPSASPSRTHASVASRFVPRVNADESTLILLLESRTDVRLVCVNNALGSGEFRYTNWGKVRTLHVWGDGSSEPEPRVLQALPWELSETQQEAGRNLGETLQVRLRIGDAYAGEATTAYDPDICRGVIERELALAYKRPGETVDDFFATPTDPAGVAALKERQTFLAGKFKELYPTAKGLQPRYERGCLVSPTPKVGLSEVVLYTPDPNDPGPGWFPLP